MLVYIVTAQIQDWRRNPSSSSNKSICAGASSQRRSLILNLSSDHLVVALALDWTWKDTHKHMAPKFHMADNMSWAQYEILRSEGLETPRGRTIDPTTTSRTRMLLWTYAATTHQQLHILKRMEASRAPAARKESYERTCNGASIMKTIKIGPDEGDDDLITQQCVTIWEWSIPLHRNCMNNVVAVEGTKYTGCEHTLEIQ
jgi:hypothetical protein